MRPACALICSASRDTVVCMRDRSPAGRAGSTAGRPRSAIRFSIDSIAWLSDERRSVPLDWPFMTPPSTATVREGPWMEVEDEPPPRDRSASVRALQTIRREGREPPERRTYAGFSRSALEDHGKWRVNHRRRGPRIATARHEPCSQRYQSTSRQLCLFSIPINEVDDMSRLREHLRWPSFLET